MQLCAASPPVDALGFIALHAELGEVLPWLLPQAVWKPPNLTESPTGNPTASAQAR